MHRTVNSKQINIKFDFIMHGIMSRESLNASLVKSTSFILETHLHTFAGPGSVRFFLGQKGDVDSRYLYAVRLIVDLLKKKGAYSEFAKKVITQKW